MDIQTRKIEFVQEFLKLQNEELISRFENLLRSNKEFKPMSIDELNIRIDKSIDDSDNDRLITSKDLMTEIEQWG